MEKTTICIHDKEYPLYRIQTIVVGSGAAGLNAAASLYKGGQQDIAILTEGKEMGTSLNTGSDKQTYYKLTTCGAEPDSVRKMAATLFDGQSMDGDLALVEAALSLRGFYHMVDIGVPFPCNGAGEYAGYKTDHDPNKRGSSAGPLTSRYMVEALWREVERYGILVFDGCQVIELLTEEGREGAGNGETGDGAEEGCKSRENGETGGEAEEGGSRGNGESVNETEGCGSRRNSEAAEEAKKREGGEKRVRGLLALDIRRTDTENPYVVFAADNIVYAVGGEAGMYATSVYPVSQTGGMGAALRAGARAKNLTESQYGIASIRFRWNLSGTFQQVIPRYVSTDREGNDEREFLEEYFADSGDMLRAVFLKGYQWPFDPRKAMDYGSSLIDLLVYQETVLKGRRAFMDYRRNPSALERDGEFEPSLLCGEAYQYLKDSDGLGRTPVERLERMNPAAIALYRSHGIDLYAEMLEIAVCAQHNNGGLAGNWWWESNLRHLFPVGEVNGSHGVYRPGGSALNSGQVGSMRAAQYIVNRYMEEPWTKREIEEFCAGQIEAAVRFGLSALGKGRERIDPAQERRALGERMSRYGANIRSAETAARALAENKEQRKRMERAGICEISQLKDLYRVRDLLVSQQVYLEAIADYIAKGGASRGSYLIYDGKGKKPLEILPESFRFSLEDEKQPDGGLPLSSQIQEIVWGEEGCACSWRPVRPVPEEDGWFEKVWRDYREGAYLGCL